MSSVNQNIPAFLVSCTTVQFVPSRLSNIIQDIMVLDIIQCLSEQVHGMNAHMVHKFYLQLQRVTIYYIQLLFLVTKVIVLM